jgi:hypothetical protein
MRYCENQDKEVESEEEPLTDSEDRTAAIQTSRVEELR